MATLELHDVRKAFGALTVIPGVSMSVEDGEFVVLVGPSGCGKSTLLRMIAGLESVSGGTIAIGNRVVNDLPAKARDIAMVFQSYALYPHMTASENMGFSLRLKGTPAAEKEEQIGRASNILGLGPYLARFPRQLSGGQRQRVAMGRALVRNPQLFLFDEPLSNLDANLRVQMRAEIKELHQRLAATTIYVTHDQIEAMTMADKIVVLRDGLVEQIGPPLELYDRPANRFVGGFIGSPAMNFLPARVGRDDGPVLIFEAGDVLRLPAAAPVREGQELVCGLRPEDLQLADGVAGALSGVVIVVEPTGSETMARMRIGSDSVTAVFRERYDIKPGDQIRIQSTPGKIHLFEPADGRRIA